MLADANKARNPPRPLIAALAVLRRDGPDALTLRAVAKEGGFSNPAIYRHYESKEALVRDVIREVYGVFKTYIFEVVDVEGDMARLMAGLNAGCEFALDHPNYYALLFLSGHRLRIDRYPDDFKKGRSAGFRFLTDAVSACIRAGELREGDPADMALTLVAHMHGLVILHQTGRFNDDDAVFRTFYAESMRRVLEGMTA